MCKCTPEMKTPFCGKRGCEWPAHAAPPPQADGAPPQVVKDIVGEIAAMEYAGDVKAIACVIIDRDGDVRTLVAYNDGAKMPVIAGCAILQNQIISEARAFDKKRDI